MLHLIFQFRISLPTTPDSYIRYILIAHSSYAQRSRANGNLYTHLQIVLEHIQLRIMIMIIIVRAIIENCVPVMPAQRKIFTVICCESSSIYFSWTFFGGAKSHRHLHIAIIQNIISIMYTIIINIISVSYIYGALLVWNAKLFKQTNGNENLACAGDIRHCHS